MYRLLSVAALVAFAILAVHAPFETAVAKDASEYQYEVLSPWAEVDPIPLRGISARLNSMEGKKIGLFANFKRSAVPQANMVEKKLKAKFPTIQTSLFHLREANVTATETPEKDKFTEWVKSVDAVVAMVGD